MLIPGFILSLSSLALILCEVNVDVEAHLRLRLLLKKVALRTSWAVKFSNLSCIKAF